MSAASPAATSERWLGLDALRGLSIAAMILVNNPGSWAPGYQYAPLQHADWHGCTPTDLVFPTFLFCAGVAIVPALHRKLAAGVPRGPLAAGIGKRVLWLVLLGWLLAAFPFVTFTDGMRFPEGRHTLFDPLLRMRFPGVLQRIGVCYGMAALLFLFTKVATQRLVLAACLLGYWVVITQVPVPGRGAPNLDDPMGTLQGWLDRLVFGSHIHVKGKYDPEGLLSTMGALATCLLGVEAGRVLVSARALAAKAKLLLAGGLGAMVVGYAWSFVLPLNKPLWTSSYAVWTAGIACGLLGVFVWAFEVRGWKRLAHPLQVYGVNALLVFVGSGLLAKTLRLIVVTHHGKDVTLPKAFFEAALLSWAEPKVASLLFALLWVSGWYAVLALLFRRGFVWKV